MLSVAHVRRALILGCLLQLFQQIVGINTVMYVEYTFLYMLPTRLSTAGDRAFPVAAARTWNSLLTSLTTLSSLASFRRQLKTELFVRSFPDVNSSVCDRI